MDNFNGLLKLILDSLKDECKINFHEAGGFIDSGEYLRKVTVTSNLSYMLIAEITLYQNGGVVINGIAYNLSRSSPYYKTDETQYITTNLASPSCNDDIRDFILKFVAMHKVFITETPWASLNSSATGISESELAKGSHLTLDGDYRVDDLPDFLKKLDMPGYKRKSR